MHHLRLAELQDCFIRFLLHLSCIWNNIKWKIHQTWLPSQIFFFLSWDGHAVVTALYTDGWLVICVAWELQEDTQEIHESLAVKITSKDHFFQATVKQATVKRS